MIDKKFSFDEDYDGMLDDPDNPNDFIMDNYFLEVGIYGR